MPQYQIQANLEVFDRWNQMADRVEALKTIVQNDMTVNSLEIVKWGREAEQIQSELEMLVNETHNYLHGCVVTDPEGRDNWTILASTDFTKIRIRLSELLTKEEAEAIGREGCEAHEYTFHGVYSDLGIVAAEADLDIPF